MCKRYHDMYLNISYFYRCNCPPLGLLRSGNWSHFVW